MAILSSLKKLLPGGMRNSARNFFNALLPTESVTQSKQKWDRLAEENARYYVLTDYGESITEEQFRAQGKKDFESLVAADILIAAKLAPFSDKNTLEIGCGIGRITEFFADHFKTVRGIDISEKMIAEGRHRLAHKRNVDVQATDGLSYPFPENYFDFVFSFIVFQHMPDEMTVRKNLAEISRVLKPGGIAKIQLRGLPTSKKNWFYGPSFTLKEARELLAGLPLNIIRHEGEGERYFWLWLEKTAETSSDRRAGNERR